MKIYVHHYYSLSLFYKLAHNTIDREYNIIDNIGSIKCKYNGINFEFIFNPELNNNDDGYHILDFFSTYYQRNLNPIYKDIIVRDTILDTSFLIKTADLLKNNKKWIISFFRMEKIIGKYEDTSVGFVNDLEEKFDGLINHYIISDNVFLDKMIKTKYDNHYFCLTNSVHQWNEHISIRWHYEYKNIFEKLNQPYDLCFSVRHHKKNRIEILNGLSKLNNDKIYLSRVDNCRHKNFDKYSNLVEKNIHNNITKANDFEDINWLQNVGEYQYLDYMFRILPMAKMHILSESWDFKNGDYASNYLSEKTIGFILAKIPFISTHSYPLEIIQTILEIENHPFYFDIKNTKGNPDKFVEFVKQFMENFEMNYVLCKNWIQLVHDKFMEKMNNQNSLLDLILNNFEIENKLEKKLL